MATTNKKLLLALVPALFWGCASVEEVKKEVVEDAQALRRGPVSAPQKNYTNMQDSLRCMDRLFLENGIRDLVVLTEDIVDNSRKMQVGARDMLISAVSDMTRRSRAVRLITFGADQVNLVNWLNASGTNNRVYTFKPDFSIRGSISQMDDNLTNRRQGAGASLGPISYDKSNDSSAAVLGMDLAIISTQTMELLPGVTSRNSIVLLKEGEGSGGGLAGSVSKQRFGVNFDFSFNRNEGSAQAVRTLVELATIELFGKLTRVPYWSCLGVNDQHPVVLEEIGDWFFTLEREGKVVPYVQNQLRIRGVYRGPVDGSLNPEFVAVVPHARKALGLRPEGDLDEPFFAGLINLKTKGLGIPAETVAHLTTQQFNQRNDARVANSRNTIAKNSRKTRSINDAPEQANQSPAAMNAVLGKPAPLTVNIPPVAPGAEVPLAIKSNQTSFAYCYYQDAPNQWMRVFPSRYVPDSLVQAGKPVDITGGAKLQIKAGAKNQPEKLACFNASDDFDAQISPEIRGADFEPNPGLTLERIRMEFAQFTSNAFSEVVHDIRKR